MKREMVLVDKVELTGLLERLIERFHIRCYTVEKLMNLLSCKPATPLIEAAKGIYNAPGNASRIRTLGKALRDIGEAE